MNLIPFALYRLGKNLEVIALEYLNNLGHIRWLMGGQCAQFRKEPFKILAGADDKQRAPIRFADIGKSVRNEPREIKHSARCRFVNLAIQKNLKLTLRDMNDFILVLMNMRGHTTARRNRSREGIKCSTRLGAGQHERDFSVNHCHLPSFAELNNCGDLFS